MKISQALCLLVAAAGFCASSQTPEPGRLKVRMSWGHRSARAVPFYVRLLPATPGLEVRDETGWLLEPGEGRKEGAWQSRAGGGDVDGVDFTLIYPNEPEKRISNLHIIWADLIAQSDADTARRLSSDPAARTNPRKLTVQMNPEGTRGFSVTVGQLLEQKTIWIPSLDVFLSAGDEPVSFADHEKTLAPFKGLRILEQVARQPEASYSQYTSRWEDMGNPAYVNPQQRGPGHIVGLTWDSAIPKFGIDRGAGVWNDYGNPDVFRFWFGFGDLSQGITRTWKRQGLTDGLPVITTVFERDALRYQVEQFAFPLHGPPAERRGDIPMVLLQRLRVTDLSGRPRTVPVTMSHLRQLPDDAQVVMEKLDGAIVFERSGGNEGLLSIQGTDGGVSWNGIRDYQRKLKRLDATVYLELAAGGSTRIVVKLPSPMVKPEERGTLLGLGYDNARASTLKFWSDYVAAGARFEVPERVVNDLFRATLWQCLRLPRRHGGQGEDVKIDLPYSSFAYDQTGTPWPVNQAVYVDYMMYDLRGYHAISTEELLAIYRNSQEPNGHLKGVANWLVYTPGMLYSVASQYLLSQDRQALDRLLPYTLKALDWCLGEVRRASESTGPTSGLVSGPLNDGTGEGIWAFNQAYMFAGLDRFGRVLEEIGHPRAAECRRAAAQVREAVERGFGAAAMQSPLVQLRDRTWIPYVPCEARTPRRILEQWYPTDVDTGAVHLLRLKALAARGELADSLLNDHEDNLYLKGWGMANEPVYNQQAMAYLLRDDPKAAIRAFYSYMASAFSHSALEPVEHRWTHGQYFGPPSTSGAWFELYRHMLIHERDDGTLLLCQATPRSWLEDGKRVVIERAPTYYGKLSLKVESHAGSGTIQATVGMAEGGRPRALLVRLRHPQGKPIRSVTVNGKLWKDFSTAQEWVRITEPSLKSYGVVASY